MKIDIRPHPVFAAILLMAVSLLPVMALKDISPSNELKYLSIVDEAIENGSIFTFSNHGEPYADKPPFYFWLAMLSRYIFGGHNLLVLSLISFVPAIVTIGVMDRWLLLVSRQTSIRFSWLDRFAGAMMLGTSVMFLGTAIILRMDMLMTMFIVLALYTFYKMYRNTGNTAVEGLLLPFYIFMALFTKGPVGLLMPVLGIFFFLLISGKLKEAGVSRVHSNLETSRRYFPNICTTHTFDDKINAIRAAQAAGLSVCSGGIMGLGETPEDRIDLALTLRALGVKSVPLNVLNPIPGTPLARNQRLNAEALCRITAVYRFLLPDASIRLAGGRGQLPDKGRSCFLSGANAAISAGSHSFSRILAAATERAAANLRSSISPAASLSDTSENMPEIFPVFSCEVRA